MIWTVSTVIAFYLLLKSWHWYCQVNGFSNFTHETPFSSILTAFNWFDVHTREGIQIFVMDLLFNYPDRLKIPYILWFSGLFLLYHNLKSKLAFKEKLRFKITFKLLLLFGIIFIVLIYILQIGIFGVGSERLSTLSFSRYINIYFGAVILFIVNLYLQNRNSLSSRKLIPGVILFAAINFFVGGIEYNLDHKNKNIMLEEVKEANLIITHVNSVQAKNICILDDTDYNQENKLRLLYHLLPHHVNYYNLFSEHADTIEIKQVLNKCDYLYVREINENSFKKLHQLSEISSNKRQLYQVDKSAENIKLSYISDTNVNAKLRS